MQMTAVFQGKIESDEQRSHCCSSSDCRP